MTQSKTAERAPRPEPTARDLERARQHPAFYARLASEGTWILAPHLRLISEKFLTLYRGDIKRLIITAPPRSGKTMLLSRFAPAWWLGNRPQDRVIVVSYQERLARRWSRAARDDLAYWGPKLWGVESSTRASTAEWDVFGMPEGKRTGGGLTAVGTGGALTGRGAPLIVVDDVVKGIAQATNPTQTEQIYEWFQADVISRLEPGGVIVILNTRWSTHDLVGRLLDAQANGEGEPWDVCNLPALAEENDPLGRKPGEALWPRRYNVDDLHRLKREVGSHGFAALYQGQPVAAEGGLFKRAWLEQRYDRVDGGRVRVEGRGEASVADHLAVFSVCDFAVSTRTAADWTVVATIGLHRQWGVALLLDVRRVKVEGPDIVPLLENVIDTHGGVVFAESGGPLLSVIQAVRRAGIPLRELKPVGDKLARALPLTAALENGRFLLPRSAPWLVDLERELLDFPNGRHDDQVDSLAYAVGLIGGFQGPSPGSSRGTVRGYAKRDPNGGSGGGSDRRWRFGR